MSGRSDRVPPLEIERVALELFARNGFEATTAEDIAAAAGISRRTFFRHFPSKNDLPWGDWKAVLEDLEAELASASDDTPLFEVLAVATARLNSLATDGRRALRERMHLILHSPALQAHSSLRWGEWRAVIEAFAARRLGEPEGTLGPRLVGYLALAAGQAAYEEWLREDGDLDAIVLRTFAMAARLAGR
jgi:mycofactocin system transcriptional regulator